MRLTDQQVRELYGDHAFDEHVDQRIRDRHELLGQGVNIEDEDGVACDGCGEGIAGGEIFTSDLDDGIYHEQCRPKETCRGLGARANGVVG